MCLCSHITHIETFNLNIGGLTLIRCCRIRMCLAWTARWAAVIPVPLWSFKSGSAPACEKFVSMISRGTGEGNSQTSSNIDTISDLPSATARCKAVFPSWKEFIWEIWLCLRLPLCPSCFKAAAKMLQSCCQRPVILFDHHGRQGRDENKKQSSWSRILNQEIIQGEPSADVHTLNIDSTHKLSYG